MNQSLKVPLFMTLQEALDFAEIIGFPIIVRPAYTLGGTGGGIADTEEEFIRACSGGLKESPITSMFN